MSCCGGCPGLGQEEEKKKEITGLAVAPSKREFEEAGAGSKNEGCKCGSNCTCDPCNCK